MDGACKQQWWFKENKKKSIYIYNQKETAVITGSFYEERGLEKYDTEGKRGIEKSSRELTEWTCVNG